MPRLAETFGTFSVALVLAHEWGHAIQDRAGNGDEQTVYLEQQADCFAGAFLAHVAEDGNALELKPGDLEASLGAMLLLRDAPGTSAADPSAHGSAFDRISAFQDGFESGAEQCATYFETPPVLVELPFSSAEDAAERGTDRRRGGDPAHGRPAERLLLPGRAELRAARRPTTSSPSTARSAAPMPKCGGTTLTHAQVENRVFYCLDDGYIGFDEPFLQTVYDEIGDFGVASLISTAWGTYVQTIQEIPGVADNGLEVVFQTDCYSGGWTAALFNGALVGGQLSPGDLDEFVQAFLVYSRARGVESKVPITFLRVAFFRAGFLGGYDTCNYDDIVEATANLK